MIQLLLAIFFLLAGVASADNYSATILADNPCHYYRMDGSTGITQVTDSATNACTRRNMNTSGGVTSGQSPLIANTTDASYLLNGSSGFVTLPGVDDNSFRPVGTARGDGTVGFTYEIWIKPSDGNGIETTYGKDGGGAYTNYYTGGALTAVQFQYYQNTSNCNTAVYGVVNSTHAGTNNAVNYIAYSTNGDGSGNLQHMRAYVNNNAADETTSFTGTMCTQSLQNLDIGSFIQSAYNAAVIDESAFYETELTAAQIKNHYNIGIGAAGGFFGYSVKRPELPHFRNGDYFIKFVNGGYNTGLWSSNTARPRQIGFFAPFTNVPDGRGN